MKKLTSEQIRQAYFDFFESKAHKYLPADKLIPSSADKTVLFTTAGMQQLVPYLVGKPHELGKRVYNIQRCVRTGDIEDVGDERHCTMFEMLGNWSLGDYFKKESIHWSYEFLTQALGIDPQKIGATVFEGDEEISVDTESIEHWKKMGLDEKRIKKLSKDDNFWGPAGAVGPCGPCSEIYYDRGEEYGPADWNIGTNDRYTEIWNNVFMEFYKDENGKYSKLSQQNVDTGMGLERISLVMQGVETVWETDLFDTLTTALEKLTGKTYSTNDENTKFFRIGFDHTRCAVFMIGDGVVPTNEGRGYVLRRILRRLYFYVSKISPIFEGDKLPTAVTTLVDAVITKYGPHYPFLHQLRETIIATMRDEMKAFADTLLKGQKIISSLKEKNGEKIDGESAYSLYETYGLPFDLIKEYFPSLEKESFEQAYEVAREKSKSSTKEFFAKGTDWSKYLEGVPATIFIGYNSLDIEDATLVKKFDVEGKTVMIFDKTPFYPTGGGQVGDKGTITYEGKTYYVTETIKYAGVILHMVTDTK